MRSVFLAALATIAMAGALCAVPLTASAQVILLPDFEVTQHASASASGAGQDDLVTHNLGPWSNSHTSPAGVFGAGSASTVGNATALPSPSLSATLSASLNPATVPAGFETNFINDASYNGTYLYTMEVLGPTATAPVHIHSLGQYATGGATTSTRFGAFVQFSLEQQDDFGDNIARVVTDRSTLQTFDSNVVASPDVTGSLAAGFTGGFNENGVYALLTNTRYLVALQFEIDMHINGFGGSDTFSGSLDPTFAIGPGAADPGAYRFIFSNGIGNSPPGGIPEPSAWALMLVGFAGLGAALRRRVIAA